MKTHVIMHFNGNAWLPAQLYTSKGPPFDRVRELLRGRWTRNSGHIERDGAGAFWNSGNGNRVLVMTEDAARQIAASGI